MRRSTADRGFSGAVERESRLDVLAQIAFTGFLYLVFVGLQPFSPPDAGTAIQPTSEGNAIRQATYLFAFLIIVGTAFMMHGRSVLLAFPKSLVALLVWCLISAAWAVDPGVAVRRVMLAVVLTSCVMAAVATLGPQRSLQALKLVLATVILVDLLSVFFVPGAVHLPGELEAAELAGNWRGLHQHKNVAGSIAALAALLFFHHALVSRHWRDWLLFLAAVIFLAGTRSKTSIAFFSLSLAVSWTYRFAGPTSTGQYYFRVIFIATLLFSTVFWSAAYAAIVGLVSDPTLLTGRVAIWRVVFDYLREHWLLGAGFGSFWQVGPVSPALRLAPQKWMHFVPHSHSGYLEILVTTGAIGLALSLIAFIIVPAKQILDPRRGTTDLKAILLSFLCFIVFANCLETIFLYRFFPAWVVFLMVLAMLHGLQTAGEAGGGLPDHILEEGGSLDFTMPALPRRSCVNVLSTTSTPCGIEAFARSLTTALRRNVPNDAFEDLAISGRWADLPDNLRQVSKADRIVFNVPLVAWKRAIVLPWVLLLFARLRGVHIVVYMHEWASLHRLRRAALIPFLWLGTAIVVLSPYIRNQIASDRRVGWTTRKCTLGLHAPTVRRPEGRRITENVRRIEQLKRHGSTVIGHFGSIYKSKCTDTLLELCAHLRGRGVEAAVVFIGEPIESLDNYARDFQQRIKTCGIEDRVIVTGYVSDEQELFAIFERIDVFLYCFSEGLTARRSSVLASLQSGRPVVVTAPSAVDEFDHHNRYASLIQSGAIDLFPSATSVAELSEFVLSAARKAGSASASVDYDEWWKEATQVAGAILKPHSSR